MPSNYLHQRKDFLDLLQIVASEKGIQVGLIEKDYWIMHVLYGLKKQGLNFELKGGTSLSKGYKIIHRFSEDIDIHITPPPELKVNENPGNNNTGSVKSRKVFYDWLTENIKIEGVVSVERDPMFDDEKAYRSGGIRLFYETKTAHIEGVKEGILLEAGFDTVTPNSQLTISSWAFDKIKDNKTIEIIDNRAVDIACYHPGYTFVEKLQTIATKFRQEQETGNPKPNLMRQYYDIYCLLGNDAVQQFINTDNYQEHKRVRFPKQDYAIPIAENEAFLLTSPELRSQFRQRYKDTAALYYQEQPDFDDLLNRLKLYLNKL